MRARLTRAAAADHRWRHENAQQLSDQLKHEFGPLTEAELRHVWDVVLQSVAVDGLIDRARLGLAVVYARTKAKSEQ